MEKNANPLVIGEIKAVNVPYGSDGSQLFHSLVIKTGWAIKGDTGDLKVKSITIPEFSAKCHLTNSRELCLVGRKENWGNTLAYEAMAFMERNNLRPAYFIETLSLLAAHPTMLKRHSLVTLGEIRINEQGFWECLTLEKKENQLGIRHHGFTFRFDESYQFVAVKI